MFLGQHYQIPEGDLWSPYSSTVRRGWIRRLARGESFFSVMTATSGVNALEVAWELARSGGTGLDYARRALREVAGEDTADVPDEWEALAVVTAAAHPEELGEGELEGLRERARRLLGGERLGRRQEVLACLLVLERLQPAPSGLRDVLAQVAMEPDLEAWAASLVAIDEMSRGGSRKGQYDVDAIDRFIDALRRYLETGVRFHPHVRPEPLFLELTEVAERCAHARGMAWAATWLLERDQEATKEGLGERMVRRVLARLRGGHQPTVTAVMEAVRVCGVPAPLAEAIVQGKQERDDRAGALECVEGMLPFCGQSTWLRHNQASILLSIGRIEQAREAMMKGLREDRRRVEWEELFSSVEGGAEKSMVQDSFLFDEDTLRAAVIAYRQRSFTRAAALAAAYTACQPDDERGWTLQGRALLRTGRAVEAMAAFDNAVKLAGSRLRRVRHLHLKGCAALSAGLWGDAVDAFRRGARIWRTNAVARGLLGLAYLRSGAMIRAAEALEEAESSQLFGEEFRKYRYVIEVAQGGGAAGGLRSRIAGLRSKYPYDIDLLGAAMLIEVRLPTPAAVRVLGDASTFHRLRPWTDFFEAAIDANTMVRRKHLREAERRARRCWGQVETLSGATKQGEYWESGPLFSRLTVLDVAVGMAGAVGDVARQLQFGIKQLDEQLTNEALLLDLERLITPSTVEVVADAVWERVERIEHERDFAVPARVSPAVPWYRLWARICLAREQPDMALKAMARQVGQYRRDIESYLHKARYELDLGFPALAELTLLRADRLFPAGQDVTARFQALRESVEGALRRPLRLRDEANLHADFSPAKVIVPPAFTMPLPDLASSRPRLRYAGRIHWTVLRALLVREMLSRFGRTRLGYLWAFLPPVMLTLLLFTVFSFAGRQTPEGVSLLGFLITGITAFQGFASLSGQMASAINSNRPLLYFRQVSIFSLLSGRFILDSLTNVTIFAVLAFALPLTGAALDVDAPLQVLISLFAMHLLGAVIGILMGIGNEYFPALAQVRSIIVRVLFLTSGVFFYANELPPEFRDVLMINPLFHCLELLRDGFFPTYTSAYGSGAYVVAWVIGGLFLALSMVRIGRRRVLEAK